MEIFGQKFFDRFKPPSNFILLTFQGETSVVVLILLCFGVEFLCSLSLMYVFIFLVQFG